MEYKKCLVFIDGTPSSEILAHYAIQTAKAAKSNLIFLFNIASKTEDGKIKSLIQKERFLKEAHTSHILCETIEKEIEMQHINSIVKDKEIDLLFYPIHGKIVRNKKLLVKYVTNLEQQVNTSLAIVKIAHLAKRQIKQVLLPLQEKLYHIEDWAYFLYTLCHAHGSHITILHLTSIEGKELPKDLIKLKKELGEYEIKIDHIVKKGINGHTINMEAVIRRADLIVMGISKRGFLKNLFERNLMVEVLQKSHCNTIIFRP